MAEITIIALTCVSFFLLCTVAGLGMQLGKHKAIKKFTKELDEIESDVLLGLKEAESASTKLAYRRCLRNVVLARQKLLYE